MDPADTVEMVGKVAIETVIGFAHAKLPAKEADALADILTELATMGLDAALNAAHSATMTAKGIDFVAKD